MKKRILHLTILMCMASTLHTQRLWGISTVYTDYVYVGGDTSISRLRSLVLNRNNELEDITARNAAIDILACQGEAHRDFLLEQLRMSAPLDVAGTPLAASSPWRDYLSYQRVRGFYGDAGALKGMDSIARLAPDVWLKLSAISYLSSAKYFTREYFEFLKKAYRDKANLGTVEIDLAQYGSDSRYHTEAGDLMEERARDSTALGTSGTVRLLAQFDKPRAIALLEEGFQFTEGTGLLEFFLQLRSMDPQGQARRSVWAIQRDPDETRKLIYFPSYGQYPAVTGDTVRFTPNACYLTPGFVKFTKDWLQHDTPSLVRWVKQSFLDVFIPLPALPGTPIQQMLDSLVAVKHQVADFGWLADADFVSLLDNDLKVARRSLKANDSLACALAMKSFQRKIDIAYHGSPTSDLRKVTIEGWKFLHYNAQYILDRLPAIPPGSDSK